MEILSLKKKLNYIVKVKNYKLDLKMPDCQILHFPELLFIFLSTEYRGSTIIVPKIEVLHIPELENLQSCLYVNMIT